MYKVLTGATLIDGTGAAPLDQAALLINGDIIEAVGAKNETPVPAEAEVIDIQGKYLLPGMIDTHIHMDLHGMTDTFQENLVDEVTKLGKHTAAHAHGAQGIIKLPVLVGVRTIEHGTMADDAAIGMMAD